jgi:hypothetical protein
MVFWCRAPMLTRHGECTHVSPVCGEFHSHEFRPIYLVLCTSCAILLCKRLFHSENNASRSAMSCLRCVVRATEQSGKC